MNIIRFCLLLFCLNFLVSCGFVNTENLTFKNLPTIFSSDRLGDGGNNLGKKTTKSILAEVPIPSTIKQLNLELEQHRPQVKIIAPQAEQIFDSTDIAVKLDVTDLEVFQDDKLNLGNHLNLILDNEPSQEIYDLDSPVVLADLTPGTHTIRVVASLPWGESFKNEGAFAQTTFSVLTETEANRPDPKLPLLTYGSPSGVYGAEPLLLDFYLTNVFSDDVVSGVPNLSDYLVKATVNGESFLLENWQPIYLTGFNSGKNWIQLELIDRAGNYLENTFNKTLRVIEYNPKAQDSLAKLVTDKISPTEAKSIVKPSYYIQPVGEPEIIELKPAKEESATSIPSQSESATETTTESEMSVENKLETTDIPEIKPELESIPEKEEEIEPETAEQGESTSVAEPEKAEVEIEIDFNSEPTVEDDSVSFTQSSQPIEVQN